LNEECSIESRRTKTVAISDDAIDLKQPSESKQTIMYLLRMRMDASIVKDVVTALLIAAPSIPNIGTKTERINR